MKAIGWVSVALILFFCVLVLAMTVAFNLRGKSLTESRPLTADEQDQLIEHLLTLANDKIIPSTGIATDVEPHEHSSAPLPARLEDTPSQEILAHRFRQEGYSHLAKAKVKISAIKVLKSTMWALGAKDKEDQRAWELAHELMACGDWDGARRYLYAILDSPRFSDSASLAWLETDPKRASRLLELSCQGNKNPLLLINAIELARATKSNVLAEHYMTRLRFHYPNVARKYELENGGDLTKTNASTGINR